MPKKMTKEEERRRAKLIARVDQYTAACRECGTALKEIRDRKLWQNTHESFEAHCFDEYGMTEEYANELIDFVTE